MRVRCRVSGPEDTFSRGDSVFPFEFYKAGEVRSNQQAKANFRSEKFHAQKRIGACFSAFRLSYS